MEDQLNAIFLAFFVIWVTSSYFNEKKHLKMLERISDLERILRRVEENTKERA